LSAAAKGAKPLKKLIELAEKHPKPVAAVLGAILLAALLWIFVPMIGSSINESRINKLEAEKQQSLKERDEARAKDLILQGKIEAKDEQITSLTSQIADSNQRVINAHNETQSARSTVSKVRSDAPHFDSADDAGRIREFSAELHGLYSDPPR
jgi:gas vesicle protein